MEPKRTLHSGKGFPRRRQEAFYSLKGRSSQDRRWMGGRKMNQEGQEIFDPKSLTEEEVAWYFIDFAREQYLVRWDDMREALKIAQR